MALLITLVLVALLSYSFFETRKNGLKGKEAIFATVVMFWAGVLVLVSSIVAVVIVATLVLFIYWGLFIIIKLTIKPIAIAMLIGGAVIMIVAVIQFIKCRRK